MRRPVPSALAGTSALTRLPGISALSGLSAVSGTLRTAVVEAAVLTGRLALYPTGVRPERPGSDRAAAGRPRPEFPGPPPVLLLHGLVDNRSVFTLLRRSLRRHGRAEVVCVNYSPLTRDVRAAAETLGERIEELRARTGHRRVDVVGHSLGGLIARYHVQRQGGDARVRTLVTLGTPHAGTRAVPPVAAPPLIRQLRPGSEVLAELAGPAPGCRTLFVSFWSDSDPLMLPRETARLDHPDLRSRGVRVRGVGHLALPVHPAVIAQVHAELADADDVAAKRAESVDVA
ncbi:MULTISPECIES: esterase/lipase family protein [unclassified Streptomyces]|uniref:esterase/lipase family protein n=1 Tax=unclassified Streptomyces TaxID=2593676 RepID=UPI0022B613AE|nr:MULTISPECIES: alpha/beta fold hydrolase [unclassified Streptomyces]MCZ7417095.1 alpha/beta fold hydrolase [Streptomyces sp. WMMC897]MCZ7433077.1 alpha/beta fold hydrolase [Streptomyces sp. WMMC1477]